MAKTRELEASRAELAAIPLKYCLYARKSTESDEKQALSIDAQIKEMLTVAQRENVTVAEIRKESHSAKASGQRPVYNHLIEDIRKGIFNGILTWAPDRLSRNAGDLGSLVDLMDQGLLVEIKTYNQKFANSPNEKFLLMILCSQAKLENDNKSLNVKRGLKARAQLGLYPCIAPTGYLHNKNAPKGSSSIIDPIRATTIKKMFEKVAYEGYSGRKVYFWLKDEIKFTTKNNKPLALANIYLLLRNSYYFGMFEYPKNSGNWYTGKHTPIISEELFDKTQERLKEHLIIKDWGVKEFAFTKLITCGLCGSGITAQEKFKKQQNGNVHHYIYYGCSKSKDRNCRETYIREEELIEQLLLIVDQLTLDELGIKEKLKQEIERYHKFQNILGDQKSNRKIKDVDFKNYVKYLLKEGSTFEKRDVLSCFKNSLILKNKEILISDK